MNDSTKWVVDTLDLAVDRRIKAFGFPLQGRLADSFRSSPELPIDLPVYRGVMAVTDFRVTAETNAFNPKSMRSPVIDLTGLWTWPAIVESLRLSGHRRVANTSGRAQSWGFSPPCTAESGTPSRRHHRKSCRNRNRLNGTFRVGKIEKFHSR